MDLLNLARQSTIMQNLLGQVATEARQLANAEDDLAGLQRQADALNAVIAQRQATITTLEGRVTTLEARITSLRNTLAQVEAILNG